MVRLHADSALGQRHPPHNWEYADEAARLAATGFAADDVGKYALQLSDNTLWWLADDSPITWDQITFGATTGGKLRNIEETIRDTIGAALVAGESVTITVNDPGDTITVAVNLGAANLVELIRDTIGATLVAGSNATVTVDDAANTVTIAASAGGISGVTVQDEGAPLATAATTLDFVGAGVTASGTGATKTITVPGGGASALDDLTDVNLTGAADGDFLQRASGVWVPVDAPAGGSGIPGPPAFRSGTYWWLSKFYGGFGTALSNNLTANTMEAYLFPVFEDTTFDRIGVTIGASVASSTVRLGIYAAGSDGLPGALVLDAGTVDSSTTGNKEITISQALAAGWYYLAMLSASAVGINRVTSGGPDLLGSSSNAFVIAMQVGGSRAVTAGWSALPDPFGALTVNTQWRPVHLRAA